MKIEVRAVGLKAMREKRGLTQSRLAHDLGISQNQLVKFDCRFQDLFELLELRSGAAGASFDGWDIAAPILSLFNHR